VCPDHPEAGDPQRLGADPLVPSDHEDDVRRRRREIPLGARIIDVRDLMERDAVSLADRTEVDAAAALRSESASSAASAGSPSAWKPNQAKRIAQRR
jgi:hypothetical protein